MDSGGLVRSGDADQEGIAFHRERSAQHTEPQVLVRVQIPPTYEVVCALECALALQGAQVESKALLELLFDHAADPDHSCRVRWQTGTVTMWDNRCVWHYALDDYREHERLMYRVTLSGERPV